ncbi:MAG: DUF3450 domain-containing protein [Planctomycetes bacterium]|nr:DUF3450 domain-containing protein [Planctomycetota bacterium]
MNQPTIPSSTAATPSLPPPPRRRRWLTALVMLVTFVCGGIVGAGAMLKFIENRVQTAIRNPEVMPGRIASRLQGRLDLSEKQHAEVLEILTRRQQELIVIRRKVQPEVETVLDSIETDVAAVLDPPQKEKWLSDVKRFRERFTPPLPK